MQNFISALEEQYLLDIKAFYASYFSDIQNMEAFIQRVFQFDRDERKPRQMLFQVQRFVSLATEIDKIRPARDGLRALFLKCCMESLEKLASIKPVVFYELFASSFSLEGKKYILDNFSLLYIECQGAESNHKDYYELTIDDILSIIKEARNMVVHEGNYWDLQIFAHDNDSTWLTHIETKEQLLSKKTYINKTNKLITYHFETTLQFEKFKFFFVEACINFINNYIESKA